MHVFYMQKVDFVHILQMGRDEEWTRTNTAVGFGFSFGVVVLDTPGINAKIIG